MRGTRGEIPYIYSILSPQNEAADSPKNADTCIGLRRYLHQPTQGPAQKAHCFNLELAVHGGFLELLGRGVYLKIVVTTLRVVSRLRHEMHCGCKGTTFL